jgi:putative transposase
MSRQKSPLVAQRHEGLLQRMRELKAEHPCWGSRRLWASLRGVEKRAVNQKRMLRLMREHHLLVPLNLRLQAKRTPMGRKPRPTQPNEWWGIDMTKVLVQGVGWGYIVVVLDWSTKVLVGYYAGLQCPSRDWLGALNRAVNGQFPEGARGQGRSLMRDHGCQPTSLALMGAWATLAVHQACTSDHNPKGHADTERFRRTLKEAGLWRQEWTCPVALVRALETWIDDYHAHDLHSALGSKTPSPFERDDHTSHSTPFVAA